MATRKEIIDVIDAFLENRITQREAHDWASEELHRTPRCEDSAGALFTFIESCIPKEAMVRPVKEQLLLDKEVLVRGVPCPHSELGKTVEAYWQAFTPWDKIVLCQIRLTERGERILEVIEEAWEGNQLFHERIPLITRDEQGIPLTQEEVWEKRDAYWSGNMTLGKALQWVLDQLQRKCASHVYEDLLLMYWRLRRPGESFTPDYIEGETMY
jgi:hypothetical protein